MKKFTWMFCLVSAVGVALSGGLASAQRPQFVAVPAPAPGRNNCWIAKTQSDLRNRLSNLHATGTPPTLASGRVALVVTTMNGNAVPNQMGPSASNSRVLLVSFAKGKSVSPSGVFVFGVDGKYAMSYTACAVSYTP